MFPLANGCKIKSTFNEKISSKCIKLVLIYFIEDLFYIEILITIIKTKKNIEGMRPAGRSLETSGLEFF